MKDPAQLWEIIQLYRGAGLLRHDQVVCPPGADTQELLKQCEVTAKNGFEAHVQAIQRTVRELQSVSSTRSNVQDMNKELLARFRLRRVETI